MSLPKYGHIWWLTLLFLLSKGRKVGLSEPPYTLLSWINFLALMTSSLGSFHFWMAFETLPWVKLWEYVDRVKGLACFYSQLPCASQVIYCNPSEPQFQNGWDATNVRELLWRLKHQHLWTAYYILNTKLLMLTVLQMRLIWCKSSLGCMVTGKRNCDYVCKEGSKFTLCLVSILNNEPEDNKEVNFIIFSDGRNLEEFYGACSNRDSKLL